MTVVAGLAGCVGLLGDFTAAGGEGQDSSTEGSASDVAAMGDGPSGDVSAPEGGQPADARADVSAEAPSAVTCDAGLTACGTSCADTQSDPRNCGACAHDCLQGKCIAGVCQGYVVVQPPNTQEDTTAATDGTSVIYSDLGNGIVAQMPVAGGNPILLANHGSSCGLALGGGKVAFCPNGSSDLWLATVGMSNSGALFRSSIGAGYVAWIAMDPSAGRVFIVNDLSQGVSFDVNYCNAVQCSSIDTRNSPTIPTIVADATHTYWADPTAGGFAYSYQSSTVAQIIPPSYKPSTVAVDSSYVYWVDTGLWNIDRMPLAGGPVQVIVKAAPNQVQGLTTDGKYVYYGLSNGNVSFAPVTGTGQPVIIFAGLTSASMFSFTTAGGFVSWVANNYIVYGARTPL
jgi:hypothetical protein